MKEEVLRLRITADLKEEVKKAAAEKGLTVSAYVTMILTEAALRERRAAISLDKVAKK